MHVRKYIAVAAVAAIVGLSYSTGASAADGHPEVDQEEGWVSLFNGKDLTGWTIVDMSGGEPLADAWVVEKRQLVKKGRNYLQSEKKYGDFVLDLEFKIAEGVNSGVFVRFDPEYSAGLKKYWTNGALEIQLFDSHGREEVTAHDCGALYDMVTPTANAAKPAGRWNRMTVTAQGGKIAIVLNGQPIIDADLDNWPEVGKNPDGSALKYAKPMKDYPRTGHLLLQDHGGEVRFRNLSIKPLK